MSERNVGRGKDLSLAEKLEKIKLDMAVNALRKGPNDDGPERSSLRNQFTLTDQKLILSIALKDSSFELDFLCVYFLKNRREVRSSSAFSVSQLGERIAQILKVETVSEVMSNVENIAKEKRNENLALWNF